MTATVESRGERGYEDAMPFDEVSVAERLGGLDSKLDQILENQKEVRTELARQAKWQVEHDLLHARSGPTITTATTTTESGQAKSLDLAAMALRAIIALAGIIAALVGVQQLAKQ